PGKHFQAIVPAQQGNIPTPPPPGNPESLLPPIIFPIFTIFPKSGRAAFSRRGKGCSSSSSYHSPAATFSQQKLNGKDEQVEKEGQFGSSTWRGRMKAHIPAEMGTARGPIFGGKNRSRFSSTPAEEPAAAVPFRGGSANRAARAACAGGSR